MCRSHSAVLYRIELRPTERGRQVNERDMGHAKDVVTFSIRPKLGRDDETRTRKSAD